MFGFLTERFQKVFDGIAGRGVLREADVAEAARQIRLNLLSADVHFRVVKEFVDAVAARAVGCCVLASITPHQQFVKVVHDELTRTLGGTAVPLDLAHRPPLIILMVGLQGSGKTTTAAKLAQWCRKAEGRMPLLVPVDVQRPAAIEQLQTLARDVGIACYPTELGGKPAKIAAQAVKQALRDGFDTVIIDTAGRLHIDEEMMRDVREIAGKVEPQHILYVADAMTGQDAAASAAAFNAALAISGVILTKLDGDARGGAALSIRAVTGKPILFVGVGEKTADFEPFHPERLARRILGMGDVVALVEHVEQAIDRREMEDMASAVSKGRLTLDEFLKQMEMVERLGPAERMLGMIPGFSHLEGKIDPGELKKGMQQKKAIIRSMTREERTDPRVLNGSRRRRIATGSGTQVADVNRLMKEFGQLEEMMKRFSKGGLKKLMRGLTGGLFSC